MSEERLRPQAPFAARAVLVLVTAALYLPLICIVVFSFRTFEGWSFEWYGQVLADAALGRALANSLIVAFASGLVATALGTAAALALRAGGFVGRRTLEAASYVSLMLPEILFALSLLAWFSVLKFTLGLGTVILAHVTFSISYVILTVGARLASFDSSLEDAARDLGASEWRILTRVTLPLLKPSITAGLMLCFLLSFDDFLITFFVNGAGSETLPVMLYSTMKKGQTLKLNALASLMWLASGVVLVAAFRSRAVRGLLKGGRA